MKKILLTAFAASVLLSGCATYQPNGSIYTEAKVGQFATSGSSSKVGTACAVSYVGLIATGDASIAAAKLDGKITNVVSIDYTVKNILGLYGEYCLEVRGN